MKKALITGITGQDGSYLAELLLSKGYEVHGIDRRVAFEYPTDRYSRINHLLKDNKIKMHNGDISDFPTLWRLIYEVKPDEVYHLAAQSQVHVSFNDPFGTFRNNIDGTHYLLAALKDLRPDVHFYFAATSEMFGRTENALQNEATHFSPASPYAISKTAGFYLTKLYREAYGMFACSGILFNHESPRRGYEFVTRKITRTVAEIKLGLAKELHLGNLDAKRDWGFAGDYVEAMWMMLQQPKADDYVIGTGENHSVREFVEKAFACVGLDSSKYVVIDSNFVRPLDVPELKGDSTKAKKAFGWQPKVSFDELIKMMVESDLNTLKSKGGN